MTISVIGGAGYVGTRLVLKLVSLGHKVRVIDTFWFGSHFYPDKNLGLFEVDMRQKEILKMALEGSDAVIHLACISNDPSFELNPELGKSVNLDSFPGVLEAVRESGAKHFIYASSSSVYGIHEGDVTENTPCNPLTDYSKFKLACEDILKSTDMRSTKWTILRPSTVCGYSARMRFDLVVNIMTAKALWLEHIPVYGGKQLRPNIHIEDMVNAYLKVLEVVPMGETYNVGNENLTLLQIAEKVSSICGSVPIKIQSSNDDRSYHVKSEKIERELGFEHKHSVQDAIKDVANAILVNRFNASKLDYSNYSNIKKMQELINEGKVQLS